MPPFSLRKIQKNLAETLDIVCTFCYNVSVKRTGQQAEKPYTERSKTMLEGAKVREWFEHHPEAKAIVENTEAQFERWQPGLSHEDMYRKLTVEDIHFISFEGWFGEKGVFAWYYPGGVPHYMKIA